MTRLIVTIVLLAAAACGDRGVGGGGGGVDAVDTGVLPTWRLQDIQPLSPRTGQTYGLDAFTDHIVVVTLVTGF